jgi:hypothetical protein
MTTMNKDFMIDKDPTSYSLITYIWVIGLSAWGGIAGYIRRVKTKNLANFSLAELVGEMCISGFVGILTFYFCESAKINQVMAAAFVGISGHMGSRALYFLEALCKRKISQIVGANVDEM